MRYKYFAEPMWDYTPKEYEEEFNTDTEMIDIVVLDRHDNPVEVTVYQPKGYVLSDHDYTRLAELVDEN